MFGLSAGGVLMDRKEPAPAIITLTTDFGLQDAYVGSMKGVILSIHPHARIVDITHELPPHRILPAAYLLREACPRFPPGTVHVAVVDPGVGGQRTPLLLKIDDRFYVGPDNGIFGLLLVDLPLQGAWRLERREHFLHSVSSTFHGRDVFAPVAAHLAAGIPPGAFGPAASDPSSLSLPAHHEEAGTLRGEVVWIDRFGNCITNLTDRVVSRWAQGASFTVRTASKKIAGISTIYESTPEGEALCLINSTGHLEVACNQTRADRALGLREGDPVVLERLTTDDGNS
jgi:S-adenosylmethionine hydrolase